MERILVDESVSNGIGRVLINDHYKFNGIPVPRVSNILDTCIGNKSLVEWAANVGEFKYNLIRNQALEAGTIAHEAIDDYLSGKRDFLEEIRIKSENSKVIEQATRAVKNFLLWESNLNKLGYMIDEIIGLEVPVITPWYGGTIDAIIRINGAVYIIDFKTSKSIEFRYPIQACAYMLGTNMGYCDIKGIQINGIGIIRVGKYKTEFEDYFLNNHISVQANYIAQYTDCFVQLLNSFYHINNTKVLNKDYRIESKDALGE